MEKVIIFFVVASLLVLYKILIERINNKILLKQTFAKLLIIVKDNYESELPNFNLGKSEGQLECYKFLLNFFYDNPTTCNREIIVKMSIIGRRIGLHPDDWNMLEDVIDNKKSYSAEELIEYMDEKNKKNG